MNIGNKLMELRKKKGLSQENVADMLNVSRQTVSKWELDQSTPDFDKIVPLCELYEISADELLRGIKNDEEELIPKIDNINIEYRKKRSIGISIGVLFYFLAIVSIMITIPVMHINPIVASAIFLIICGFATFSICYVCLNYKIKEEKNETEKNELQKTIEQIFAIIFLIIYLLLSFITNAWHITWILWIIYALTINIVKLILMLKGDK